MTRLAAIEELADVHVLCSEKGGTLTQNKLTLGDPFSANGIPADQPTAKRAMLGQQDRAAQGQIMTAVPTDQLLTEGPAWKALQEHCRTIRTVHLREIFADDPLRGERLTAEAAGLYLDYSKHRVTDETLRLLVRLADERGLSARIEAMFRGEKINVTEQRAVLRVALRAPVGERIVVDGADVVPAVHAVLDRMATFADEVRGGHWKGHTGRPMRNIVNIGIGAISVP